MPNEEMNQEVNEQEKKAEELKKKLQAAEDEYNKQKKILEGLNKRKEALNDYDKAQQDLYANREREIDIYDFSKRKSFKEDIRKELPENEEKYRNAKNVQEKEYFTEEIDKLIQDGRKKQNNYTREDQILRIENVKEYNDLVFEVENLRKDINADKDHPLSKEQNQWISGAKDDMRDHSTYTSQHYRSYEGDKKNYKEKKEAYDAEFGTDRREARWNEEFAEYQTLVARRMAIKNAIKKIGMKEDPQKDKGHGFKLETTFKNLDSLKNAKEGSADYVKFVTNKQVIAMKMTEAFSKNHPLLLKLGYNDIEQTYHILDDYYEIEKKVNDYHDRMMKYGTKEQKEWIEKNQDTRVEKYFANSGEYLDKTKYLEDISKQYSPDKNTTADRMRVEEEMKEARFRFYQSAQSLRLNQRDLINTFISDENKVIKAHNAEEKKKKNEFNKWKNQEQCDKQFLKSVNEKASSAASTRRKMMVGSALTGFASKIMSSIGDKVNEAGMIAAGGIIKGERVQVENELKDLKKEQEYQERIMEANIDLSNRSYQTGVKAFKEQDTNKMSQAAVDSGNQALKSTQAAIKYNELGEKIKEKEKELLAAQDTEKKKMDELTVKITGKSDEIREKLKDNQLNQGINDMNDLGNRLADAQKQLNVVEKDSKGEVMITDDVIRDLMNAKTDYRREELLKEESESLKKDKDLKEQLKTMQEYSDKLSSLFTPDNLGKVDTIVSIVETLYKAYGTVSDFIEGNAEKDEKKDEKKDGDQKEEDKKEDKKEEDKKEEDKKEEDKNEEEKDENFELNIKGSISDLKEKAEAISKAMRGDGEAEDQGTIVSNITELTLEAGAIVNVVSKKIQDITDRLQTSLEEAQAREEVEKGFLAEAEIKGKTSPVASAKEELAQQRGLHQQILQKDRAANETAILKQEDVVNKTKEYRDNLLKEMNLLEEREKEEQEKKQREEEEAKKKAAEEQAAKERAEREKDTPAVTEARNRLEQAIQTSKDAKEEKEKAETDLEKQKRVKETLDTELRAHQTKLANYANSYDRRNKQAEDLDKSNLTTKDKQQQYLERSSEISSEAGSKIRKTAVKSFFVDIANTTADYTKSFMDQLSIGFAEAVVKGKVKQKEDELAEKEKQYRLKGETALAKDRSKLIHVKKAQEISRTDIPKQMLKDVIQDADIVQTKLETLEQKIEIPKDEKKKKAYQDELKSAAAAEKDAEKLHRDRSEIAKEIAAMGEDLANAKVEEEKELKKLHEELKKSFKIDPEAAMKIDIRTEANLHKVNAAKATENEQLKELDPMAYLMSTQFTEINANQRQVIQEQVEDLKKNKALQAKAAQLNDISEKLKSLCTPKNMGRVDTVISVAEGLYGLYGTVKGMISGGNGGEKEENEDEEEKNIAGKIKDIKDKTADIRKGMMGEGEAKEEEPKVIENILSITQSVREIMDVVSTKINTAAKEYHEELESQRAIKKNADKDIEELKEMFDKNPDITIKKAFEGLSSNPQQIVVQMGETIKISQTAVEECAKKVEEAQKAYDQINEKFLKADKDAENAKKNLEDTIKSEKERIKAEQEKAKRDAEEKARREREEAERKVREQQEREQAEQRRKQEERDRNDKRMKSLNDIMENLKDTKNAYKGHTNTDEFNAVVNNLKDFLDKKEENINFTKGQTEKLEKALTEYLDHTGMKVAWHEKGNVRKENVLAALNLINPDKAKEYEQKANSVRKESKKINLDLLMEKEGVRRKTDNSKKGTAQTEKSVKSPTATATHQK